MKKRIFGSIVSIIGFVVTIWQVWPDHVILGVCLSTLLTAFLLFSSWPVLSWWCRMIKWIKNVWRHPDWFLYICNFQVNLLHDPPSDIGKGNMWSCQFEIVSVLPWRKCLSIVLDVRQPEEIAGMEGKIERLVVEPLSKTVVPPHVFKVDSAIRDKIKSAMISNKTNVSFLPIRILVTGRDDKDREIIRESINFTFQRSK